eukprot:tig00001215_g7576.t1
MAREISCAYWLISAPAEDTKEATWQRLQSRATDLATNFKFNVPDLRVGTLDALLELSDELAKTDIYVEGAVHKIERQLHDLNPEESITINQVPVNQFLERFQWDEGKYSLKKPLREIVSSISEDVTKLDEELKLKASEYNVVKSNLGAVKRKAAGNLLVKNLAEVVKPEHFVESENLTTCLVAVPKAAAKEFQTSYESLTDYVVPRSGLRIAEDNDFELWRVVCFKRVADDYKNAAREKKFTVRDFKFDENTLEESKGERSKLEAEVEKLWAALVKFCRVAFADAFVAWIHLKAIRVFVESVLRYGLPVNFQAMLLKPKAKTEKKLRETLHMLYSHLGGAAHSTSAEEREAGGAGAGQGEFFPYVYFGINPLVGAA